MSGAARRFVLIALAAFGMTATARGQSDDRLVIETDFLEMKIVRRSDGAVLENSTERVDRYGIFPPGCTESLKVIGLTVSEVEAVIARQVVRQKTFSEKVDVRVRFLDSPANQRVRILYAEGEGIEGRSIKPIATGPKSSITIVKPPDILTITAVRRSDRFELFSGEHLVRPNGAVSLGVFGGEVEVAGLTVPATRWAITRHLAKHGYAARDIEIQIEILRYRKIR